MGEERARPIMDDACVSDNTRVLDKFGTTSKDPKRLGLSQNRKSSSMY